MDESNSHMFQTHQSEVCFFLGFLSIILTYVCKFSCGESYYLYVFGLWALYGIVSNLIVIWICNGKINLISLNLGHVFSLGFIIAYSLHHVYTFFGIYLMILTSFHFSEYFVTKIINPLEAKADSFLINHSTGYTIAALASFVEYFAEVYLVPRLKGYWYISAIGLSLCVIGDIVRKLAMLTAGQNFNHMIQYSKKPGQKLITHGIYHFFRHPSYFGWFYWCIGTQLLLCNPLCFIGYIFVAWKFFKDRIHDEEIHLINFFGQEYIDYKMNVQSGLPYIYGYQIKDAKFIK